MKLWNVEGKLFINGWEWRGRRWSALVYDLNAPQPDGHEGEEEWVWQLHIGTLTIARCGHYHATPVAARNALIRAVKRLGIRAELFDIFEGLRGGKEGQ